MASSQRALYIGFVGGGFNTSFHIHSLLYVRNCYVAGVTSGSTESAQRCVELAKKLRLGNPKIYATVEEMAASEEVNAIWICCPNYLRIEVMEAIVRGNEKRKEKLRGVACEKPLARNVAEAKRLVQLAQQSHLLTGYLENQVFAPAVVKGKEVIWSRAVPLTGRPYLCRAAEEHSGPHKAWFWQGSLQGGGVLNDMMCHSVEAARFLLTEPTAPRHSLIPIKVNAQIACLKWSQPHYAQQLKQTMSTQLDYEKHPSEDYAHATVTFKDQKGQHVIAELTTSWSFVGPGLRLSFELLGPEYSLRANTLNSGVDVFFSRRIQGKEGEYLLEKQNAEQGLMPLVVDEENVYGYSAENRHMVECFLDGTLPSLTFEDGLEVVKILMACYLSAQQEKTIDFQTVNLDDFVPDVAKGEWKPFQ